MDQHAHSSDPQYEEESLTTYTVVFFLLLVLLVLTYVAYEMDLNKYSSINLNLIVAMIIAVIKAALVLMVFMHVRLSPKIVWVFSISAFFWLALMIAGFENDYVTRGMDASYSHTILSPEAAAMVHAQ